MYDNELFFGIYCILIKFYVWKELGFDLNKLKRDYFDVIYGGKDFRLKGLVFVLIY